MYRIPFDVGVSNYDDPPPDVFPDPEAYLSAGRARFINDLQAWIDVEDGRIVDFGQTGRGRIGSTSFRFRGVSLTFAAVPFVDRRKEMHSPPDAIRFEQTCGGRTGVPTPRRVVSSPLVRISAPPAWTTLSLTLHADGSMQSGLVRASPFPRHWVYGADGGVTHKSAHIDYHRWLTDAFGGHTPWGHEGSAAYLAEAESALERTLSAQIMRSRAKPRFLRLQPGELLTEQGRVGDQLYLLLDGVLSVRVNGEQVAEVGPGAVLGERAGLESGCRTASLAAVTKCRVAVADRRTLDSAVLQRLAEEHRHEETGTSNEPTIEPSTGNPVVEPQ